MNYLFNAININNMINKIRGKSAKNQAILLYPALQIRLRIQVQNITYMKSRINITEIMDALHVVKSMQYAFFESMFTKRRITIEIIETTK
jgi:hypothetical protein